jgi:diguanylate cyclase
VDRPGLLHFGLGRGEGSVRMIGRWLLRRRIARAAVGGLAVGVVALAALALLGSWVLQNTTSRVRSFNEISARWEKVSTDLSAEHSALNDFIANGGSPYRRTPLVTALNSAEAELLWLSANGGRSEATPARMASYEYTNYTEVVQDILKAADQGESLAGYWELAALNYARTSDLVTKNIDRRQQELTSFLERVEEQNARLRSIEFVLVAVDFLLCLLCAWVLIGYQRRAEQETLEQRHLALHDVLTGLANRQLLTERTEQALREALRNKTSVALLLVDLDRFKAVNDALGHHSGDLLLQETTRRLTGVARSTDTVARIGGDEFAILLPGLESKEILDGIAERIRYETTRPLEINGLPVDFGASIGISVFPSDCNDSEGLMRHADMAMYVAKRGGLGVSIYAVEHPTHLPPTMCCVPLAEKASEDRGRRALPTPQDRRTANSTSSSEDRRSTSGPETDDASPNDEPDLTNRDYGADTEKR